MEQLKELGLSIGQEALDGYHLEFYERFIELKNANNTAFAEKFAQLIEHTEAHFAHEESLMEELGFQGTYEHKEEHNSLLNEMRYFYEKSRKMPMFGRSYVNEYAFDKFKRHVLNIDSQLAMFLKERS